MKQAIIVINEQSGGYTERVKERIQAATRDYECRYVDIDRNLAEEAEASRCDLLVVAGGDGTLRSVVNKLGERAVNLLYVPCGTLNERAKARRRFGAEDKWVLGKVNDQVFTYVMAAGSFTPIGYVTEVRAKKRWGRIAYLAKVLSEYKVHAIAATVDMDGEVQSGDYTLIMCIKCDRCFGFRFNRLYRPETHEGHVLLIKSPKGKGMSGKIKMFFPFFRAFFVGFGKPYRSEKMTFAPYTDLNITLGAPTDFDVDGEKVTMAGDIAITFDEYPKSFAVLR